MMFAVIVIISVLLCWVLGIYAVYTYREVEMAKLEKAHEIMRKVKERDEVQQ